MVNQHDGFKTEPVYIVAKNPGSFRVGEPAKVVDIVWLTPEGGERRVCLHVLYSDGVEDFCVFDLMDMHLVSESDVKEGNLP